MLKLGSTPDKREQHRLMRDAMEKRFIRVARGSLVGGIRLGMFTAGFYGLQNLLAEKRGVIDVYNVVGAGSATASTFGLICEYQFLFRNPEIFFSSFKSNRFPYTVPGTLRWRLRNAMLGSVLGAAICFPLGEIFIQLSASTIEQSFYFLSLFKSSVGLIEVLLFRLASFEACRESKWGKIDYYS